MDDLKQLGVCFRHEAPDSKHYLALKSMLSRIALTSRHEPGLGLPISNCGRQKCFISKRNHPDPLSWWVETPRHRDTETPRHKGGKA